MATLERIRQRSGLLIIAIGLAMLAFILTDLLGSGGILFNDTSSIGKVDGKKISREEFVSKIEELKNSNPQYAQLSSKQLADFVWNNMLREQIMGKEYKKLGFAVTSDELFYDIIQNEQIQQAFTDPNTGVFDETRFKQYVSTIRDQRDNDKESRDLWNQWIAFEKGMKEQSQMLKYNYAVEKGLYTPKALAREEYIASNQNYDIQFVQLQYSAIPDSTITVTDSDIRSFYKANKEKYKQKAVRNIEYIFFPTAPSQEDRIAVQQDLSTLLEDKVLYNTASGLNDTVAGFKNTDDDSSYVATHSDRAVDMSYYTKGQLNTQIDSLVFNIGVPGSVYGPYEDENGYSISKISEFKNLPDSVKARHILISYQGAERADQKIVRTPQEAKALADSLFEVVKGDLSQFENTSQVFNDDVVAASKGGDLGWFKQGMMAPQFNNYSFYNKTGDVGLVATNFGFHIIHITDQKGANRAARISTIYREVLPSETTLNNLYSQASSFASEAQKSDDFRKLAEEKSLVLRPATNILEFDENIPGLGMSRKIVRWIWDEERKEGEIGLLENDGQGYAVVVVTDIFEEGYTPIEKIEDQLRTGAMNKKKGEMLTKQLAEAKTATPDNISSIAQKVGSQIKTQNINRKSSALTGSGTELKVIGMMTAMPLNTISEPVAGENAAYIFVTVSMSEAYDKGEYNDEIQNANSMTRSRVAGEVFESIKKGLKVVDKRALFY